MRAWLLTLPGLTVLLAGCGRTTPRAATPARPRAQSPRPAHIVFAQPSPTGDALAVGTLSGARPAEGGTGGEAAEARPLDALWLVDLRTGRVRDLPTDLLFLPYARRLSWRPDGGAVAAATPAGRIEVYDFASSARRVVSPEGMYCAGPAWSPDGKRLVVTATTRFYRRPAPGEGSVSGSRGGWPGETYRRETHVLDTRTGTQWEFDAGSMSLYSMPADGSGRPRLEGDAPGGRVWYWNAELARLLSSGAGGRDSAARQRVLGRMRSAQALALAPDCSGLAYSMWDDPSGGAALVVLDRSLAPVVEHRGLKAPANWMVWSPDGATLLASNRAGEACLLDMATKGVAAVDEPVLSGKEPVGWVQWKGKRQLALIDEASARVVVTERVGAPVYTLVTLNEDGTPALALPIPKEK